MYRSLITNTAISAIAYAFISVFGIITVGWLVKEYGLGAYGMITLARLFLPSGLLGLLDLGAPENASHAIAKARATQEWDVASTHLAGLTMIVWMATLPFSLLLLIFADRITCGLNIHAADIDAFSLSLRILAFLAPVMITGLIAEGITRGFERYSIARGIEVFTAFLYGVGCYLAIAGSLSAMWVIYMGIACAALRSCIAFFSCYKLMHGKFYLRSDWITSVKEAWKRTKSYAPNKIVATIQTQSPAFVVGLVIGPAGAGTYDLLTRLPRFSKAVLGLINSAVMPFTSRLEAQQKDLKNITENGLVMIASITAPLMFAAAAFSQPILRLWLDKELAHYWYWQALGFLVPLVTVVIGFGYNSLFSRLHVNRAATRFVFMRTIIQYLVAFALLSTLSERAFVLGGVVAVMATAFWEIALIMREHSLSKSVALQLLYLMIIGTILFTATALFASFINSFTLLVLAGGIFVIIYWVLAWLLVIPSKTKKALLKHCL